MCDRCFMVREFVFLRGGVSKCPAVWYGLPRWGAGSLVFHTKTDSGILAHTTSKVNLSKLHDVKVIYFKIHKCFTETHKEIRVT